MRIAITGASGFCGRHVLALAMAAGHDVITIGRTDPGLTEHRGWDAAGDDGAALDDAPLDGAPLDDAPLDGAPLDDAPLDGVEVVIHLAAAVGDSGDPRWFHRVNVGGTNAVLRGARRTGARVVHISTASVYDHSNLRGPIAETSPRAEPRDDYSATKQLADDFALDAGATVLRPHAVYGVGDPHLVPRLLRLARHGVVPLPGADVWLSITHVANLATACLDACNWAPGAYNIADAEPVRRDALVCAVARAALGREHRVVHLPRRAVFAMAQLAEAIADGAHRPATLTRYGVTQLAHPFVLDLSAATATGWHPHADVSEHLQALERSRLEH